MEPTPDLLDDFEEFDALFIDGAVAAHAPAPVPDEVEASVPDPFAARLAELEAELAQSEERVVELLSELREERELRFAMEDDVAEQRGEIERACQRRLEEMSSSYHDTLAALRRAYEQRLKKADGMRV